MKGSPKASTAQLGSSRTRKIGSRSKESGVQERRISTPRPDLIVVKIGGLRAKATAQSQEKTSTLVASLAKAIRKPGTRRDTIFNSSVGKSVFAYSVDPQDTTKIVREDASGKTTRGRLVDGRFRAIPAKPR